MKISTLVAALALGMSISSAAFADGPAKPDAAEKAARSAECGKEADAKNLHLKERKKFLAECKKTK